MRKIIHIDLDAFFCAVEELRSPSLAGLPFAVGGKPDERGVVSSCSYPARQFGVHSAMPVSRALRLCPQLVMLPPNFSAYRDASHQVMEILNDLTPLVEQISIDEAFLDLSDLPESVERIAARLQRKIQDNTRLPCSLGVAANKLVAKIATDFGKASHLGVGYPNAVTVVPPGEERGFLAPLPVKSMWGVGPKTAEKLAELGVRTIGDLAATSQAVLTHHFGKMGFDLLAHAQGRDDSPVTPMHIVKSVSQEITFEKDSSVEDRLRQTLILQSEQVGYRLRCEGMCGLTVRLKIRWPDFTTLTRQVSLAAPTDQDREIAAAALALFESVWKPGQRVRLIGVGVSGLSACSYQLSLWDSPSEKDRRLVAALDQIRIRYGEKSIRRGFTVKK